MNVCKRLLIPVGILIFIGLACTIPGAITTEDLIRTQIALTQTYGPTATITIQQANNEITETPSAGITGTISPTISSTVTQSISATVTDTLTATVVANQDAADCNIATFIKDVTVPDGTKFSPGETFDKTWRLKNVGTCTWTTDYAVVFASGEQMSGPNDQKLTKNVEPGDTVDITLSLTAPTTAGDYRGKWKLRTADGVIFGLTNGKPFYVEITVKSH